MPPILSRSLSGSLDGERIRSLTLRTVRTSKTLPAAEEISCNDEVTFPFSNRPIAVTDEDVIERREEEEELSIV